MCTGVYVHRAHVRLVRLCREPIYMQYLCTRMYRKPCTRMFKKASVREAMYTRVHVHPREATHVHHVRTYMYASVYAQEPNEFNPKSRESRE